MATRYVRLTLDCRILKLEVSLPLTRDCESPNGTAIRGFIEALPDLVATFDADGRLLLLNRAGRELLGFDPQYGLERALPTYIEHLRHNPI